MKNKKYCLIKSIPMILVMVAAVGCTIHFPYDYTDWRVNLRIVFSVQPDDAEVVLNGRMIGLAYEYANRDAALVLASKDNELLLRKRGYQEEAIDLYDYPGRDIIVQLRMKPLREFGNRPKVVEAPKAAEPPAKVEAVQTPPPEKVSAKPVVPPTIVTLTVTPADAAIYIKGKFWGIAPEDGRISNLRLPPGKCLFEVTKPGFKTFTKEIEIPKQEKFELKIDLEK